MDLWQVRGNTRLTEVTMKKCPVCGAQFDDSRDFCRSDGTALVPVVTPSLDDGSHSQSGRAREQATSGAARGATVRRPATRWVVGSVALVLLYLGYPVAFRAFSGYAPSEPVVADEEAYITAMKSDLRNLITAQEVFFESYGRYATSRQMLVDSMYRTSTGVAVMINSASLSGFEATATYTGVSVTCHLTAVRTRGYFDGTPFCTN